MFFMIGFIVLDIAGYEIDSVGDMPKNSWLFSGVFLGIDLLLLLVFWKRRYTRNWIEYGYTYGENFSTAKLCLLAIVGAIGCLMLDVLVQEYVPIPIDPDLGEFFELLMNNPIGILTVCLTGPLMEEAVFRGAIERRLLEKNWNPWFAIVISAVLFAAAHGNYEQGLTAVIIGCFMGWVYYRTRSIWPTFLIHAFNNTTAVVAAYSLPESMDESLGVPLSTGITLIVVSLILIYIAARGIGKITNDRTRIPEPVPVGEVLPPPFPGETVVTGTPIDYPQDFVPTPDFEEALQAEEQSDDLPMESEPQD